MRQVALVSVLAVLLLAFLPPLGPAAARSQDFERVREYIDATQEILERVWETVRESGSPRARKIMAQARDMHLNSLHLYHNGRPLLAFKASQRAREAAKHAARLAREELGFEERVRIRLERLRDLHDNVLEKAQEERNQRALRFIREAERQFLRAREQFAQRNFQMAFNLVESCEVLLRRAARLLFEGGGVSRLERELERTGEFLDRLRERLGEQPDEAALVLLGRAEETLGQAQEAFAEGDHLRALHLARQARRLAGQASSLVGRGPSVEEVTAQIERWDDLFETVADAVRASGREEARLVLERATRYRHRAEEMLTDGDRLESLRQIKIAHDLLREARELAR